MLDASDLFFSAAQEQRWLRLEAEALLAQSLAEEDATPLRAFLEGQLATDPPPLPLLHDIALALEQRALSLRGAHADVRQRVVAALQEAAGAEPGPSPERFARYHELTADEITAWAQAAGALPDAADWALLGPLVEISLATSRRLHAESEIAAQLARLLADWLDAHDAAAARHHWRSAPAEHTPPYILPH